MIFELFGEIYLKKIFFWGGFEVYFWLFYIVNLISLNFWVDGQVGLYLQFLDFCIILSFIDLQNMYKYDYLKKIFNVS